MFCFLYLNRFRIEANCFLPFMARSFDSIEDIKTGKDNWKLKVRVIRLWVVSQGDDPEDIFSVEMVLLDDSGFKIQATMRKGVVSKFKNRIQEGCVYRISNLSVFANSGFYKVTSHKFRLYFLFKTSVAKSESVVIPTLGINLTPFSDVLAREKEETSLIDVVGLLVGVSGERDWEKNGRRGNMIIMELMDEHGKVECALFGDYVQQLKDFLSSGNLSEVVVLVQWAKLKIFQGKPVLQNVLQATRMVFNYDGDEVLQFRERISNAGLLELYPSIVVSAHLNVTSKEDFLSNNPRKRVGELAGLMEVGFFIVVADISGILGEAGWFYPSCKCNRAVVCVSGIYYCPRCEIYVVDVIPRYKLEVEAGDSESSAVFLLFDREVEALVEKKCVDMLDGLKGIDSLQDGKYPEALDIMIGKRVLFKVEIRTDDYEKRDGIFRVKKMCFDDEIVNQFVVEGENMGGIKEVRVSSSGMRLNGKAYVNQTSQSVVARDKELVLSPLSTASEVISLCDDGVPLKRNLYDEFDEALKKDLKIQQVSKDVKIADTEFDTVYKKGMESKQGAKHLKNGK